LGEAPEIPQLLWGLWAFHVVRAALGRAREIAEEFAGIAERVPYSRLAMEARILLTRIYSTFTEGFDTSDMLEAKALLS
jgi:hypothetical protein